MVMIVSPLRRARLTPFKAIMETILFMAAKATTALLVTRVTIFSLVDWTMTF